MICIHSNLIFLDVAERVLDRCLVPNDLPNDHPDLEVTFNYEFLDDMFACYKPYLYDKHGQSESSSKSESSSFNGKGRGIIFISIDVFFYVCNL